MPRLRLYEIPYFLRNSRQYKDYEEEQEKDEDQVYIDIPHKFFLYNDKISSLEDFKKLLGTVDYWDFFSYPETLTTYVKYNIINCLNYLHENSEIFYILEFIKYVLPQLYISSIEECVMIHQVFSSLNISIPQNWYNYCLNNKKEVLSRLHDTELMEQLNITENVKINYTLEWKGIPAFLELKLDFASLSNNYIDLYNLGFFTTFNSRDNMDFDQGLFNKQHWIELANSILNNVPFRMNLRDLLVCYGTIKIIEYEDNKLKIIKTDIFSKMIFYDEAIITDFNRRNVYDNLMKIIHDLDEEPIMRTDFTTFVTKEEIKKRSEQLMPSYVKPIIMGEEYYSWGTHNCETDIQKRHRRSGGSGIRIAEVFHEELDTGSIKRFTSTIR
jgi:hypothetical protein